MRKFSHINKMKPLTVSAEGMVSVFAPRWLCGLVSLVLWFGVLNQEQCPIIAQEFIWAGYLLSLAIL